MAILDKKAEINGTTLPEDVRAFIATHSNFGNVRELEGALTQLLARSSLGEPINLAMARQTLGPNVRPRVSIDAIQKAVAEHFDIKPSQLKERSNTRKVVFPRQVAMYLASELTDASLTVIGRAFGGKHYTTVLHSVKKIEKQRHTDADLNRLLQRLMESLQSR